MINFHPPITGRADPRALALPAGVFDFNPTVMIACLRGRVLTRKALLDQSEGDVETLKHEQAIAEYEAQIERLQGASQGAPS